MKLLLVLQCFTVLYMWMNIIKFKLVIAYAHSDRLESFIISPNGKQGIAD